MKIFSKILSTLHFKLFAIFFIGSRFQTTHDFGYVALDIQYVRPDDNGVYMCRASNELGEAVTTASVKVQSKYLLNFSDLFNKFC